MSDRKDERAAARVVGVSGIGTNQGDELAFVEVLLNDGNHYRLAFDIGIANPLALAFVAASSHLAKKQAMRQDEESTLISGEPVTIAAAYATPAMLGSERVVAIEMQTKDGMSLLFSMTPRAAEAFAKRLQKKGSPHPARH